ncbi:MFS transporter [Paenibacillus cremeus]|uniref:MFS transporter n=1 Tax=Paenibacillus cremeus TaxID=2163881 RepID=A0A559KAT1_9BACL|nr:MFS transporter [Paenibacillus cremeus]TVY09234.1 MFS transporter [Paenibacillus cremeus]
MNPLQVQTKERTARLSSGLAKSAAADPQAQPLLTQGLIVLMAISCGITVANLYYNQPLLADIGRSFGVGAQQVGLVSMLTQIGYALGMFLFIPLGDIQEKRRLITTLLITVGVALIGVATAQSLTWIYIASLAVGVTTVAPQMIIPLAAGLAAPQDRGKVIGSVMSGLLIGILLARTVSGWIGELFGWRSMYGFAAVMMFVLAFVLSRRLPVSRPDIRLSYPALVRSIGQLIVELRTLREAALIAAFLFGSFSVFWTALTFYLEGPNYGYGSGVAGLFGLVGVVGALAASVIGRLTSRIQPRFLIGFMIFAAFVSYVLFWAAGGWIWGLIIGVILLDLGVQGGQVTNQARIYSLLPEARSRINTVYMVSSFIGGAIGSTLGAYAWSRWGWSGVCVVGGAMVSAAFLIWAGHRIADRLKGQVSV